MTDFLPTDILKNYWTANLRRPFALLRFRIRLPPGVFIRFRNPCVFLRRLLLICRNVIDIICSYRGRIDHYRGMFLHCQSILLIFILNKTSCHSSLNHFNGINGINDSLLGIIMSDISVEKSRCGFLIKGTDQRNFLLALFKNDIVRPCQIPENSSRIQTIVIKLQYARPVYHNGSVLFTK